MKKKIKDLTLEELNDICIKQRMFNQDVTNCLTCPLKFGYSSSCWRSKVMVDRDFQLSHFDIEKNVEVDE